jgi:cytochrome c biogenesis protein CcmG/thiol:disulfide interchange protein DsbE
MKRHGTIIGTLSVLAIATIGWLGMKGLTTNPNALMSQLVGKAAPAIEANTAQGDKFSLNEHLGKRWVVLNFWMTSCIVCREEAPELQRFYEDVTLKSPTNPLFVSINIQESNSEILNYLRDMKQTFPVVSDRDGRISLEYGVYGTPETFFIDLQGKVRHRVAGGVDTDSILRFVDWLEKNPNITPEQASEGFVMSRGPKMGG